MKINESRHSYGDEPRRYVQPLDFKKEALDAVGRSRHYIAALLARVKRGNLKTMELVEALESADREAADAQRHLMGQITLNDRGETV